MRIDSVQALRAGAALSVATLHVLHEAIPLDPSGTVATWHDALPWEAGVDMFFVISGFIMVHASHPLFGQPGAAWRFLSHRLARIVPLYWVMTAAFLAVAALAGGSLNTEVSGPAQITASLLFIPWPRPGGTVQPVFSLGWTLNYEMLFYAVFTLFIRMPRPWALACVTAGLAALAAAHGSVPPGQPQFVFWTDPVILEFLFGMAVAVLRRADFLLPPAWRAGLALCGLTLLLWLHGAAADAPPPLRAGLPMAMILAAVVLGQGLAAPASVLLLGEASYALYLVHPFPMRALGIIWPRSLAAGPAASAVFCVVCLATSIVAAIALHLWVERPATRRLRSWFNAAENG